MTWQIRHRVVTPSKAEPDLPEFPHVPADPSSIVGTREPQEQLLRRSHCEIVVDGASEPLRQLGNDDRRSGGRQDSDMPLPALVLLTGVNVYQGGSQLMRPGWADVITFP